MFHVCTNSLFRSMYRLLIHNARYKMYLVARNEYSRLLRIYAELHTRYEKCSTMLSHIRSGIYHPRNVNVVPFQQYARVLKYYLA